MNNFKQWMVENRLSADQVAKALGVSKKSIYAYMQGYRSPNKATMKLMEKVLGIDIKKMFLDD